MKEQDEDQHNYKPQMVQLVALPKYGNTYTL